MLKDRTKKNSRLLKCKLTQKTRNLFSYLFIFRRLKHLLQTARTSILERMHKIIIKEFEVITLLALNIWAPRNHSSSESKDCAEQVRTSLFNDLHYLYHDGLKIDNYAGRIGEVMCLYTDVQVIIEN